MYAPPSFHMITENCILHICITSVGITQFTRKEHIARATIEATCYQTKAILDAMEKDSGTALHALVVDGGMSNSDVCMQVSYMHRDLTSPRRSYLLIVK